MAHAPGQKPGGSRSQLAGLTVVRLCAGTFMFFFGVERAAWLMDADPLAAQLSLWLTDAPALSRWYLERVLPGTPVFARLVPAGSMLGGMALLVGFWTRLAAGLSLLIVLGLQLAAGSMFRYAYVTDAGGLLLAGALVGLTIGGGRLPPSARR